LANTKSALKMIRVAERKRQRNAPVRAALRTKIKTANTQITSNSTDAAASVVDAISALDKAAAHGVIHPNNAARRKSRLMRKLNKAPAA
jgi:small subunit ribosomal protein S20